MTWRVGVGVVAAAGVAVLAGCGAPEGRLPPGPDGVSGRFSGNDGNGLGIVLDFTGFDATSRRIAAALPRRPGGWSVGIAAIVNRGDEVVLMPKLFATRPNGIVSRMERASQMRDESGAVVPAPDPGPIVRVDQALTVYVVFPGAVRQIRRVEMLIGSEPPVALTPQKSRRVPEAGG